MDFLDRYMTPAVKTIFLLCVVLFLGPLLLDAAKPDFMYYFGNWFALYPPQAIFGLRLWQFVSYIFMHGGFFHLLANMLVLFFFGPAIENRLGTRLFWIFFLTAGIVAGLAHTVLFFLGVPGVVGRGLVGASGAIMFVALAFAAYYPNQEVLLYFAIPVKMKVLIGIYIALDVLGMTSPASGISHIAHLGGLVTGYVLLSLYHRDWDIRHWRWR